MSAARRKSMDRAFEAVEIMGLVPMSDSYAMVVFVAACFTLFYIHKNRPFDFSVQIPCQHLAHMLLGTKSEYSYKEVSMSLLPSLSTRPLSTRLGAPWRALAQMEQEMDRLFNDRNLLTPESRSGVDFIPQCDIRETPKKFFVRFDVPGMKKEDIKIELEANCLTVSGERKEEKEEKDEKRHYVESYYGSFSRSFTLPSAVSDKDVDAEYKNGVLTVKVNKKEESRPKAIAIH